MTDERARYLLARYLQQACTREEQDELFTWISKPSTDASLERLLDDVWQGFTPTDSIEKEKAAQMLSRILSHETDTAPQHRNIVPVSWLKWSAAAAVVVGVVLIGYNRFVPGKKMVSQETPVIKKQVIPADVAPGTTAARLTLGDGSSVLLDTVPGSAIASQGNTKIIKKNGQVIYQNGQVIYQNGTAGNGDDVIYNVLTTDRGHQYPLTLSDGTKVFLNSASAIRFPVEFNTGQRIVDITGEAYFEVAKNGKPFIVKAGGSTVEVLGTHFNVNSYADEAAINTTLLEGSVKIRKGNKELLLAPGQQAQVKSDGSIGLNRNADTESAISWTHGYFHFNDASLETVLRQLARWYDVDVVYEKRYPDETFGGDIQKNLSLSQVAKILEKSQIKFGIHGKQLIVQ